MHITALASGAITDCTSQQSNCDRYPTHKDTTNFRKISALPYQDAKIYSSEEFDSIGEAAAKASKTGEIVQKIQGKNPYQSRVYYEFPHHSFSGYLLTIGRAEELKSHSQAHLEELEGLASLEHLHKNINTLVSRVEIPLNQHFSVLANYDNHEVLEYQGVAYGVIWTGILSNSDKVSLRLTYSKDGTSVDSSFNFEERNYLVNTVKHTGFVVTRSYTAEEKLQWAKHIKSDPNWRVDKVVDRSKLDTDNRAKIRDQQKASLAQERNIPPLDKHPALRRLFPRE